MKVKSKNPKRKINCDQTSDTEITRKDKDQRDDQLRMNEYTRPVEESLTNDKETGRGGGGNVQLIYLIILVKERPKGK